MKLVRALPSHASVLHKWRSQPHTRQFNEIDSLSIDELAEGLAKNGKDLADKSETMFQWLIEVESKFVGHVRLRILSRREGIAEIGFNMGEDAQGKGLCTKAVREVIGRAFGEGGLRKIVATSACDNIASWKVLEKNGFVREGLLRSHFVVSGYARDYYTYGLLKAEFDR